MDKKKIDIYKRCLFLTSQLLFLYKYYSLFFLKSQEITALENYLFFTDYRKNVII